MSVGQYRSTVETFKQHYPPDQFDWNKPDKGCDNLADGVDWTSEVRHRLHSMGRTEDDDFALTSLSIYTIQHRGDGDLLGVQINWLSESYHQQVFSPDEFMIEDYLRTARIVSKGVISLTLFDVYPLSGVPDGATVYGSLLEAGVLPDRESLAVATHASRMSFLLGVLSSESFDLRLLKLPEAPFDHNN